MSPCARSSSGSTRARPRRSSGPDGVVARLNDDKSIALRNRAAHDETLGKEDAALRPCLGVGHPAIFVIHGGPLYNVATSLATSRRRVRSCRKWASAS